MSTDALWQQYIKSRDAEIRKQLIEAYVPLIKIVAGRMYNYYGGNVDYDDLVSYGAFGLIDAIEKYEYERKLKFETYAQIRIRGSIIDQLRKLDWVPRSMRKKSKDFERVIFELENKLGRSVNSADISKAMNISIEEVEKTLQEMTVFNMVSLEDLIHAKTQGDFENDKDNNPEQAFVGKELSAELASAIESLPYKEKLVISLYYYEELTYKEIAEIMSLSESRISQIHSKVILKLRGILGN